MREETFTLQSTLEANYLNIELQESVCLDEIAVHVIKEDCPDFLIPFHTVNVNDRTMLKYKLINTIALEYSGRELFKKEFVKLYLDLLTPFIEGKDWFLDYHNFCIDPRYIYLDRQNACARFIYVPAASYRNSDEDILQFFKNTFVAITIRDDANFQVKLYQFFSGGEFTLSDLYHVMLQESQRIGTGDGQKERVVPAPAAPVSAAVSTPMVPPASEPAGNPAPVPASTPESEKKSLGHKLSFSIEKKPASEKKEHAVTASVESYNSMEGESSDAVVEALFGGGGKKKNTKGKPVAEKKKEGGFSFFGRKKQEVPAPSPVDQPSYGAAPSPAAGNVFEPQGNQVPAFGGFAMIGGEGEDRTEIFSDDVSAAGAYLELFESPVPGAISRIELNFTTPFITIGRMSSDEIQPDIAFGREFSRIGRKHARIEKREGVYYVIDLGSANHTLLNGQILIPNQPYQLTEGCELTFTTSKPVRYRVHL